MLQLEVGIVDDERLEGPTVVDEIAEWKFVLVCTWRF